MGSSRKTRWIAFFANVLSDELETQNTFLGSTHYMFLCCCGFEKIAGIRFTNETQPNFVHHLLSFFSIICYTGYLHNMQLIICYMIIRNHSYIYYCILI